MVSFKHFMMGKKGGKDKLKRYSVISGRQKHFLAPLQSALKGLNIRGRKQLRNLLQYKSPQLKPYSFKDIEAPALQQFQEQIVPSILERFAGAGSGAGALSSSGLQQTLGQAAKSLSTQLAANRAQYNMSRDTTNLQSMMNQPVIRQNALNQLQAMNQFGLNPTHSRYVQQGAPAQQGFLSQIAPVVGAGIGLGLGTGIGGLFKGGKYEGDAAPIAGMNFNAMGG